MKWAHKFISLTKTTRRERYDFSQWNCSPELLLPSSAGSLGAAGPSCLVLLWSTWHQRPAGRFALFDLLPDDYQFAQPLLPLASSLGLATRFDNSLPLVRFAPLGPCPVLCNLLRSLWYSLNKLRYQQCSTLSVFYLDLLALCIAPCSLYVCFLVSTVLWFSLVLCLAESRTAGWIGKFPPLFSFAPLDPCPALSNFFKRLLVIFVGRNTSAVATTHTATRNYHQWCSASQSSGASSPSHQPW